MKNLLSISCYSILVFFLCDDVKAQYRESVIKAGLIAKIVQYVQWEEENTSKNFEIAVLGDSVLAEQLLNYALYNKIKGEKVDVRIYDDLSKIKTCDVVYIGKQFIPPLGELKIKDMQTTPLVFTDTGCRKGVHFNFYLTRNGTLHFELNKRAIKMDGFKVDVLLVKIAKTVEY